MGINLVFTDRYKTHPYIHWWHGCMLAHKYIRTSIHASFFPTLQRGLHLARLLWLWTYIHAYIHTSIAYMYACILAYMPACKHTCIHKICSCIHTYIHAYMHTCLLHTYMHKYKAYIQSCPRALHIIYIRCLHDIPYAQFTHLSAPYLTSIHPSIHASIQPSSQLAR